VASPSGTAGSPDVLIDQQCIEGFAPDSPSVVALGSLTPPRPGSVPPIALLDLTNPLAPQQLCTYQGLPWQVRLIGLSNLGYAASLRNGGNPSDGVIGTFDVSGVINKTVVRWQNGGFGAGTFAWSSDGTLAYILATAGTQNLTGAGSWELHLVRQGQDGILTTLPGVPGRGVSGDNDDVFLGFSPGGKYLALETTFTGPSQVRAAADGSLVMALPQGITMAVWAGDILFYRDQAGVHRWEVGGTSRLVLPGVSWIRPRASPDGKWIVYSVRDSTGLHRVNVYNLTSGSGFPISSGGRVDGIFLSPTVLWEREERLCTANDSCGMSQTVWTGTTFVYDLASRQETRSTITGVADVWPRMD